MNRIDKAGDRNMAKQNELSRLVAQRLKARAQAQGSDADAEKDAVLEVALRVERLERETAARRAAAGRPRGRLAEICGLPANGELDAQKRKVWTELGLLV